MKFMITEVREIEVEVDFPVYKKSAAHVYKVINENTCICACHTLDQCLSISLMSANIAFRENTEDSTAEEFEEKYNETLSRIKEKCGL